MYEAIFVFIFISASPLLNLSNTSPAVLDSEVKFTAILINSSQCHHDDSLLYQWQSNVEASALWHTFACYRSELKIKFERPIKPATYGMDVCVYRLIPGSFDILKFKLYELIAKGEMDFKVTGIYIGFKFNGTQHRKKLFGQEMGYEKMSGGGKSTGLS